MSFSRSGRQRDAIWADFEGLPATSKQKCIRAKCKACGKEVQGLVQRLRDHKKKCEGKTTTSSCELMEEDIILENEKSSSPIPSEGKRYSYFLNMLINDHEIFM